MGPGLPSRQGHLAINYSHINADTGYYSHSFPSSGNSHVYRPFFVYLFGSGQYLKCKIE